MARIGSLNAFKVRQKVCHLPFYLLQIKTLFLYQGSV